MKKSVLSGLITGVLTIVTAYAAPSASAEETTDESTQTYETDAIVITASRSETTISDVPADVTLISGEQIERGNYKSVSDALKGANINVVQKGFAAYPVINGDSRVLVMVDGKKVNWDHLVVSGDTNAVDVDQIAIGDVERIEIVRGPNSSLYGERAVSGVINIITKRPTTGKPSGSFNMQLGSWGEKRAGVNVSGGDEKNMIRIGASHERRKDFQYKNAEGNKRTFGNSDIEHTDYVNPKDCTEEEARAELRSDPNLQNMKAIRENRIIIVNFSDVNNGNGRCITALEDIAAGLDALRDELEGMKR